MKRKGDADHLALIETLKRVVKARGLTYADLAKDLGVADVTVKRFFAGSLSSFPHVYAICELLGVSFLQVASLAGEQTAVEETMTLEQDAFFAEDPRRYPIFLDLYRRESLEQVRIKWGMSQPELFLFLRGLEAISLLELHPGNRLRFLTKGPLLLHREGILRRIFLDQNFDFLTEIQAARESPVSAVRASEVLLSEAHVRELREEFVTLFRKWRAISFADETLLPKHEVISVRWLFALGPFRGDWGKRASREPR